MKINDAKVDKIKVNDDAKIDNDDAKLDNDDAKVDKMKVNDAK